MIVLVSGEVVDWHTTVSDWMRHPRSACLARASPRRSTKWPASWNSFTLRAATTSCEQLPPLSLLPADVSRTLPTKGWSDLLACKEECADHGLINVPLRFLIPNRCPQAQCPKRLRSKTLATGTTAKRLLLNTSQCLAPLVALAARYKRT